MALRHTRKYLLGNIYKEIFTWNYLQGNIQEYVLKFHKITRVCGIWTKMHTVPPYYQLKEMGTPSRLVQPRTQGSDSSPGPSWWAIFLGRIRKTSAFFMRHPATCSWGNVLDKCSQEAKGSILPFMRQRFYLRRTLRSQLLLPQLIGQGIYAKGDKPRPPGAVPRIHWALSSSSWGVIRIELFLSIFYILLFECAKS